LNRTIPDLTVPGNKERGYRLESAKRRSIYDLDTLGFPHGFEADGIKPGLAFEFKADIIPTQVYRTVNGGLIPTLNLSDITAMTETYKKLGIALNEMNRSIGLLDYLPEMIAPLVVAKLTFVHQLARPTSPALNP